jgi:hypothetical protein
LIKITHLPNYQILYLYLYTILPRVRS